ncbi:YaeP family protein [Utexia brackfieldae]|uniref:YaeP family protein n=1 Tax=Utexia brackfieldae TaxID=3074108 RepID=UPI00370DB059
MNKLHPLIKQRYAEIGSNELGYMPNVLDCVLQSLDTIVRDERVPEELRERAAFAAANLLISDYSSDLTA